MIVQEISPFKGSMMCIELGGGELMHTMKIYIHSSVIAEKGVVKGMEISEDQTDDLIFANDLRRARERALYLLEGRDYSYIGLYNKLEENYEDEICRMVCDKLAELRLLDDRRYAEKLCRQLFEVKKLGRFRVKQEMKMKGIPESIIAETLENFADEDEDAAGRLEELVEKKYERYLVDRKGVMKVKNALARKGYSYAEISAVLSNYELDFEE